MRIWIGLAAAAVAVFAQPPVIEKVEPPNWWANHSINPVRVLIHGHNLKGGKVLAQTGGVTASREQTNAAGTYLLVDVSIPGNLPPGPVSLFVSTSAGRAAIPFAISKPLDPAGRFQGFSPDDVIYLIMPDRFANGDPSNDDPVVSKGLFDRSKPRYYHGGDLQGVIDKLPYLKSLGITAIWLNPVYDNVNHLNRKETYDGQAITDYHGYGAVDFYGVEEHFGTLDKFRQLVDEAHAAGIKIIQDQVANHTGPYHDWVNDSPTLTWFNGTAARHLANTWQTWTLMDPGANPAIRKETLDGWFIDILPDLNQNDPETRRYLIQNTLWWIGVTGLDGIRQDTWPYVPREFWRDWMAAIKRQYPKVAAVGEVFDGDPAFTSFSQGGRKGFDGIDTGVDSVFDFPLYFAIRNAFGQGGPVREVAKTLAHDALYPNPSMLVTFAGLHDVQRFMNEKGATVEGLELAFTLLMTTRGIPMIYYGDELALPGGNDPDNRRDFPGGWPGDSHNAFTDAGRTATEQRLVNHVRKLTAMRAQHECLRRGHTVHLYTGEQVFAYARIFRNDQLVIVLNNSTSPVHVSIPVPWQQAEREVGVPARSSVLFGPEIR
jgi:neopullulanase